MIKAVIATFKTKQISALSSLRLTVVAQNFYLQALSFFFKQQQKDKRLMNFPWRTHSQPLETARL